jgi:manganese/zinc/iron transport system permease protein
MLTDFSTAFWTILTASCCSVMCAWLGIWLVLQRLSMVGDAISHSVLPGLVVVFLTFGTHHPLPMALGAAAAGLLTVFLMRSLSKLARIQEDSSLGIVFTVMFALGVILITRYASDVDLDPACVLYGLIEFVTLDSVSVMGIDIPRALATMVPMLALVVVFLIVFRKELLIMAFDSPLAQVLGKQPNRLYYALIAMVALVIAASFEAVGSILVIAMLIGPAAISQLLTRNLKTMYVLSALIAVISSALGYLFADLINTSVAGMMSVVIGVFYVLAIITRPKSVLDSH